MKKVFTKARYLLALVSLVLLGTNVAVAEETYPDDCWVVLNNGDTASPSKDWYTLTTGGGWNANYKGTVYGTSIERGLKINSAGKINFTTTQKGTVTIAQGLRSDGKNSDLEFIKFDDEVLSSENCTWVDYGAEESADFKTVRIVKIKDVEPGDHEINQAKEWGCLYFGVTYNKVSTATPVITTDLNGEYSTSVGTAVLLSVVASDATTYQWYKSSTAAYEGEEIPNATAESYSYKPTSEEIGEVYFYCIVTNENATGEKSVKSKVAKVTVTAAYTATFTKTNDVIGTIPAAILTGSDCQITIPANNTLFVEGKTLSAWEDESQNTYKVGETYTLTADVTLSPVFTVNTKSMKDVTEETKVSFISEKSYQVTYQTSEQNVFVEHVTVDGETIDLGLLVKGGKFDMQPSTPRAQTNNGTTISIPVTKGAKIYLDISDAKGTEQKGPRTYDCTINGEAVTDYLDGDLEESRRKMTYEYDGDESYIDYVINTTDIYTYAIDVTYPVVEKKSVTATITDAQYATFYADFAVTIPEDVTAYGTTLNEEKNAIVLTAIEGTVIPAKTAVIIYSDTETDYTFTETKEAGEDVESALTGTTTEETEVPEGAYVLGNKNGVVGFYHLAEGKKIGANQAYLTVPENARIAFIGFGDSTVTAIDAVAAPASDGKAYNLNGVQAAPNAKGLVIKDGKKYVNK